MKIPSLFSKTPKHRKFSFTPRFYDEQEYDRREREERIRRELQRGREGENNKDKPETNDPELYGHRTRIAGSFKASARRPIAGQSNSSTIMVRFVLFTFLTVWVIAYLQYGNVAFYGLLFIVPIYLFMRGGSRRTGRR